MDTENHMTNPEILKLLPEMQEISKKHEKIKKIFSDIDWFYQKVIKYQQDDQKYNEYKKQIEDIVILTKEKDKELENELSNIHKMIQNIEAEKEIISELKVWVQNNFNDIENNNNEAISLLEEIKEIKTSTSWMSNEVNEKVNYIQKEYDNFIKLIDKIYDEEDGIEHTQSLINDVHHNSKIVLWEIKNIKKESDQIKNSIEETHAKTTKLHDESAKNTNEIQKNLDNIIKSKEEADEKVTAIKQMVDKITDTTQYNSLNERKNEINHNVKQWWWIISGSISIFIVLLICSYICSNFLFWENLNFYEKILARVIFMWPLFFFILFAISQYKNERGLSEKYAFKASSSITLRHHIDYIMSLRVLKNEMIGDFILQQYASIYTAPFDEKNIHTAEEIGKIIQEQQKPLYNEITKIVNWLWNKVIQNISDNIADKIMPANKD